MRLKCPKCQRFVSQNSVRDHDTKPGWLQAQCGKGHMINLRPMPKQLQSIGDILINDAFISADTKELLDAAQKQYDRVILL